MNDIQNLLTQGSPLVVLVAVVFIFLKHIATDGKANREMLKEMHCDHITARREMRETMEKNTSAMIENTVAMRTLARGIETYKPNP